MLLFDLTFILSKGEEWCLNLMTLCSPLNGEKRYRCNRCQSPGGGEQTPVACYLMAAMPGNSFPSKYSNMAPPPVDT